jgi:hypothetical protein
MPVGTDRAEVDFAFNTDVVTALLRDELGLDGIVCTDWGLIRRTGQVGLADHPSLAHPARRHHLPKSMRPERMRQNFALFDSTSPSPRRIAAGRSLFRRSSRKSPPDDGSLPMGATWEQRPH